MKKMQQLRRKLATFTALLCVMTVMGQTQTVVNVVDEQARVIQYSTLYVGEVLLDGQQSFYYLYSEDLTNSDYVFGAVRYCLSDFKDGIFSDLVPYIVGTTEEHGIALCSNSDYESIMNSDWKQADKAGLACLPNSTVISSSSEDLYETDADFAAKCLGDFMDITLLNNAGESLAVSGILGKLSTSITDNVTYTVIDGKLVKHIDRYIDYTCEMTTVIYTKVELATASTPILGDINDDGIVSITDVTMLVDAILTGLPQNTDASIYDINGDGDVTVADVTVLVDMILNGNENTPQAYLTCPDDNHPHLIDLGLPSKTKWACCNVGASAPEGYGGYYAWGETEEKDIYDWITYIHCDGSEDTCHDIGDDIAGTQYDVAHVKWGGIWQMPTSEQINELIENCMSEWTTQDNVNGRKFTSSNGGTIFLPAAGDCWGDSLDGTGIYGMYWSSTLDYDCIIDMGFNSDGDLWVGFQANHTPGRSVRPVSR